MIVMMGAFFGAKAAESAKLQSATLGGPPVLDLIATATALTAATVALAIERFAPMRVDELIVSGGGARNPQIMNHLAAFLPGVAIAASSDFGIDIDAKEAIAFAILGYQTWHGRPANLPSATAPNPAFFVNIFFIQLHWINSMGKSTS